MIKKLSVIDTKNLIGQQTEYALIDVREQQEFAQQHQLLSCCMPYSRLEDYLERLVPCKKTPVILTDSGNNKFMRSERAALIVDAFGYSNVYIQEGGLKAWIDAGLETFEGVNVLSKTFGELVAEECNTPLIRAKDLAAKLAAGEDITILDVRPYDEFKNMCIPGGVNTPGSEVLYRLKDQIPNPDTHVLVNCAGRTRGLLAAQLLINANIPNPVSALKGGTMGWELDNLTLEYGQERYSDFPSESSVSVACELAANIADKVGVNYIDLDTLQQWEQTTDKHTLYIFDVRQPQEFQAGHYPGSRHVEGGQLIQATDEHAPVRCAHYVIVDDTSARANTAAAWLTQMGYPNVYVLQEGISGLDLVKDEASPVNNAYIADNSSSISAEELQSLNESKSISIIDIGRSDSYAKGHIPHSLWVPRARLSLACPRVQDRDVIVIVSDDISHAQYALADAKSLWPGKTLYMLSIDRNTWLAQGHTAESGIENTLCETDDIWYRPYKDANANIADMQSYFDWQFGLVEKLHRDGDAHFCVAKF